MDIERVPAPLRERLGVEATGSLLALLELSHEEWKADVVAACGERLERRLAEEASRLRVQIAQTEAVLRRDMAEMGAGIRAEMAQIGASIREDMAQMGAGIRVEMAQMGASIREELARMGGSMGQEIATGRVELFKWCFLFWIGQVVATTTMVGIMIRLMR